MPSKLKIYTRTGDAGKTSLYGGTRVEKHNLQVVAYGTVDELNSAIGVLVSFLPKYQKISLFLTTIQSDLFTIGSHLASGKVDLSPIGKRVPEIETFIDSLDEKLKPLKNFILPGGTKEASFAHLARSICRRAEREVIRLAKEEDSVYPESFDSAQDKQSRRVDKRVIMYLNRLSDLLFITARFLNKEAKIDDIIWRGK